MFTGIVEAIGRVEKCESVGGDTRLLINTGSLDISDVQLGDSICTNGCCLTVVELHAQGYTADVSKETLNVTTLSDWSEGKDVNLERSLTPMTRMGGHMVSGHVDGIAEILSREPSARSDVFWVKAPRELAKYIAKKGSVTIDGTSLTVNDVRGDEFCLTIVPHTLQETVMSSYAEGTKVNIEVDLIARYLERLRLGDGAADATNE